MKKILFTSIILFACFNFAAFAQNSLNMQPVKTTWYTYPATITSAEVFIQPRGLFVEYNLYMQYSAKSTIGNAVQDTFEIQHFFQLPENAMIVDSWLWVNNTIMKAFLLDRWSAFNIYEGIVKRRKDPSILYKNSPTNYEYRVYPLAGGGKTRKVKLTFLLPAKWRDGKLDLDLPINMLTTSYQIPDFKINVIPGAEWSSPSLSIPSEFKQVADSINGVYYTTTIAKTKFTSIGALNLSLKGNKKDVYFSHYQDTSVGADEGYYQMALQPKKLLPVNTLPKKKVVYFIDHEYSNTNITASVIKLSLKESMLNTLEKGDSFNIVYTKLLTKKLSEKFIAADTASIENAINQIDLSNSSNLRAGLPICYDFLKENKGNQLIVISSSTEFTTVEGAQSFKDALEKEYGKLTPTFILNYAYANIGQFIWQNGQYFYGNDLFYNILATNSLGSVQRVYSSNESLTIDLAFSKIMSDVDALTLGDKSIELLIRPENGICFEKYEINASAANLNEPIIQIGRYKGELPFNLETIVLANGNVYTNTIVLPSNNWNVNSKAFKQIHQGQKLKAMEERNSNATSHIAAIIDFSKKANILSKYTAFLALEPGLQDTCKNCIDQTTIITVSSEDVEEEGITIKVFPNPFKDKVTIAIEGIKESEEIKSMEIFNIQGSLVHTFDATIITDNKLTLTWDAENESSGVYIFKLMTKDKVKTMKLVKY